MLGTHLYIPQPQLEHPQNWQAPTMQTHMDTERKNGVEMEKIRKTKKKEMKRERENNECRQKCGSITEREMRDEKDKMNENHITQHNTHTHIRIPF